VLPVQPHQCGTAWGTLRHLDRPLLGVSIIVYNTLMPVAVGTGRVISLQYLLRFVPTTIMSGNLHRPDPSVYLSWPTPNYVNPVRRSWMPAYACTLLAASTLVVVLRLWLRATKQAGPFGLDDVCVVT
jgi:hypothetical protein